MNGGHQAVNNAKVIVKSLSHGSKAVSGAGSVRNKLGSLNIRIGVYTADEHRGIVLGGCRHNDIFGSGVNMPLSLFLGKEQTGRFNDVFGADFVPLQVGRVLFSGNADSLAVDNQFAVLDFNGTLELAVHSVITQHISHIFNINQVVDADDFDVISFLSGTENQAADTAKSVNTDANCHIIFPSLLECKHREPCALRVCLIRC